MGKQRRGGEPTAGRREFLKNMLVGSAGVALVVSGGEASAAPEAPPAADTPPGTGAAGYRETDHVRAYYQTAGL